MTNPHTALPISIQSCDGAKGFRALRNSRIYGALRTMVRLSRAFGFDAARFVESVRFLPDFWRHLKQYNRQNRDARLRARLWNVYPILHEAGDAAGVTEGHYFHQDLWAARKIHERLPARHLDIGSRIDGFVSHLLVFMPVTVVDIRPMRQGVTGLTFVREDATNLEGIGDESVESLSSLHAAEHFGLGRYGDRIDPDACFHFMNALQRVLAPGGRLYFSVPIGRERVEFNAHRIFEVDTILKCFSKLRLVSFSFIGDDGRLHENIRPADAAAGNYGCGLFEFTRS